MSRDVLTYPDIEIFEPIKNELGKLSKSMDNFGARGFSEITEVAVGLIAVMVKNTSELSKVSKELSKQRYNSGFTQSSPNSFKLDRRINNRDTTYKSMIQLGNSLRDGTFSSKDDHRLDIAYISNAAHVYGNSRNALLQYNSPTEAFDEYNKFMASAFTEINDQSLKQAASGGGLYTKEQALAAYDSYRYNNGNTKYGPMGGILTIQDIDSLSNNGYLLALQENTEALDDAQKEQQKGNSTFGKVLGAIGAVIGGLAAVYKISGSAYNDVYSMKQIGLTEKDRIGVQYAGKMNFGGNEKGLEQVLGTYASFKDNPTEALGPLSFLLAGSGKDAMSVLTGNNYESTMTILREAQKKIQQDPTLMRGQYNDVLQQSTGLTATQLMALDLNKIERDMRNGKANTPEIDYLKKFYEDASAIMIQIKGAFIDLLNQIVGFFYDPIDTVKNAWNDATGKYDDPKEAIAGAQSQLYAMNLDKVINRAEQGQLERQGSYNGTTNTGSININVDGKKIGAVFANFNDNSMYFKSTTGETRNLNAIGVR